MGILKYFALFWGDFRNRWWEEWQERLMQAYGVTKERLAVREEEEEGGQDGDL